MIEESVDALSLVLACGGEGDRILRADGDHRVARERPEAPSVRKRVSDAGQALEPGRSGNVDRQRGRTAIDRGDKADRAAPVQRRPREEGGKTAAVGCGIARSGNGPRVVSV